MPKQRIHIILGAVVDYNKWFINQEQNEEELQHYLERAAQDKINRIQCHNIPGYHGYFEIEYSGSL